MDDLHLANLVTSPEIQASAPTYNIACVPYPHQLFDPPYPPLSPPTTAPQSTEICRNIGFDASILNQQDSYGSDFGSGPIKSTQYRPCQGTPHRPIFSPYDNIHSYEPPKGAYSFSSPLSNVYPLPDFNCGPEPKSSLYHKTSLYAGSHSNDHNSHYGLSSHDTNGTHHGGSSHHRDGSHHGSSTHHNSSSHYGGSSHHTDGSHHGGSTHHNSSSHYGGSSHHTGSSHHNSSSHDGGSSCHGGDSEHHDGGGGDSGWGGDSGGGDYGGGGDSGGGDCGGGDD